MDRPSIWFLRILLFAVVVSPLLAFVDGVRDGRVVFVLYREPKLAAVQILGWGLLAMLAWCRPGGLSVARLLISLRRPPWRFLALFLGWGLVTVLWVRVPENLCLEIGQYGLLFALVLALDAWADLDTMVERIVELGLVLSLGAATVVGFFQAIFPVAALNPVDPPASPGSPSFLGYKNPMALAVVGQIFLLVLLLLKTGPGRRRRFLVVLLAAELVYVATLNSRTSWAALFGATALLGALLLVREGLGHRVRRAVVPAAVAVSLFVALLAADPISRERAASVTGYLMNPSSFLESDRGTYLLNTLNMVRHRPLGVGLGDWQTWYPVYRLHRRDLFFSETVQVRKAHSDPVQYLGETGWPGLALWLGFVGSLLAAPAARYLRSGDFQALLMMGQVAALAIAMLTDSVVEHPYGKLQLLLIGFLAVRAGGGLPAGAAAEPPKRSRRSIAVAVALTVIAVAASLLAASTVRKAFLAATAVDLYREAREGPAQPRSAERALLEAATRAGEALTRTPGFTKDLCDDELVIAHSLLLLGYREKALAHARESLRLHPYNPAALRMMAVLLADRPAEAALWWRAYEHVSQEATRGFEEIYPELAPPAIAWYNFF